MDEAERLRSDDGGLSRSSLNHVHRCLSIALVLLADASPYRGRATVDLPPVADVRE
jgi:hypothetical protein